MWFSSLFSTCFCFCKALPIALLIFLGRFYFGVSISKWNGSIIHSPDRWQNICLNLLALLVTFFLSQLVIYWSLNSLRWSLYITRFFLSSIYVIVLMCIINGSQYGWHLWYSQLLIRCRKLPVPFIKEISFWTISLVEYESWPCG